MKGRSWKIRYLYENLNNCRLPSFSHSFVNVISVGQKFYNTYFENENYSHILFLDSNLFLTNVIYILPSKLYINSNHQKFCIEYEVEFK
jgi:hypothetical protein